MEKKYQSFTKQVRKHKHILYDLFVAIKNVIIGGSLVRSSKNERAIYMSRSCANQPTVLLAYEETTPGRSIHRNHNSFMQLKREESPEINMKNLSVSVSNREIKESSFALVSKQEINQRRIIYDLFVTIENIIVGASSTTRDVIDGIIAFKIKSVHQPTVLILYDLPPESENNSILQLIDDQEKHISKNTSYISKPHSWKRHFANTTMTNLAAVTQQEETETLNVVSEANATNKRHKNNSDVKRSSLKSTIISLNYGKENRDFTDNTLLYSKKLCNRKAASLTFEKEKVLLNVNSMHSTDNAEKETTDCRNLNVKEKQLERLQTRKEFYNNSRNRFQNLSKRIILERMHTGEKSYKCQLCEKTFAKLKSKNEHERRHTRGEPYKCEYCEKTFPSLYYKLRHERVHTGEKPFKCEYCEKAFAYLHTKKSHEKHHTGEKPHKCDYCEKTFAGLVNKIRHESLHTGERPYKCEYCEKTFIQLYHKMRHERLHTGEKPYKCNHCDKTFARLSNKIFHENMHTGEKPFTCEYCEKTFTQLGNKINHERVHTGEKPFKCGYCEKTFVQVGGKINHERVHTGEKPFKCDYCDKTFNYLNCKKSHERLHTREEPFECDYCKKTFAHLSQKIRHERQHTGE